MNAAVGNNAPAWMCIEAIGYSTADTSGGRDNHRKLDKRKSQRAESSRIVDAAPNGYILLLDAAKRFSRDSSTILEIAKSLSISMHKVRGKTNARWVIELSALEAYYDNPRSMGRPRLSA
jgi:hypothetical protein